MVLLSYLKKHQFLPQQIAKLAPKQLGIIVVIPVYNEPNFLDTLVSLGKCTIPNNDTEVILVFNAAEHDIIARTTNEHIKKKVGDWYDCQLNLPFQLYFIEVNELPKKHAGVGLARKIGMDEAVRRFASVDNENGIIACFDADSMCKPNYLVEIEKHFNDYPNTSACSIHFEHPTTGKFDKVIYHGIIHYELHLRYYKNALKYAGLPYAFHTVGSSMAVKAKKYCMQGGMNKRKAGEDFYFLQKFIQLGDFTELSATTVYPSPRESDRVPFGTGRALMEMKSNQREIEKSYAFETFRTLKDCFSNLETWFTETPHYHECLISFIGKEKLEQKRIEIKNQSNSIGNFKKRFFQWFNAFQTLKFVHFLRDNYFPLETLTTSTNSLVAAMNENFQSDQAKKILFYFRKIDKGETLNEGNDFTC